jgi:hypothetical protein
VRLAALITLLATVTAAFVLAPLTVGGCLSGSRWTTLKDPHGLTVELPAGWDARVEDSGFVLFQPTAGGDQGQSGAPGGGQGSGGVANGPAAFVWPLYVGQSAGQAAGQGGGQDPASRAGLLLDGLWPLIFGDWPKGSTRWIEERGVLVGSLGAAAPARGMAILSVTGDCGMLSGWWTPPDTAATWRPVCLRVLGSFASDPSLVEAGAVGAQTLAIWTDPNEGAFTIKTPSGWTCQGGLVRPYIDAAVTLRLTRGTDLILFEQPRAPIYVCPNWVLDFSGFTKGSTYPTGPATQPMIVWDYLPAADYVEDLLVPDLARSFPGLKVDSVREVDVPDPRSPLVVRSSGAVATLSDDGGFSYGVVAVTQLVSTAGNSGLWLAATTMRRSRPEDAAAMARMVSAIGASVRVDPAWAAAEAKAVAQRTQLISQTGEDIAAIVSEAFAYQSAVGERLGREWSNAILGRTDVYDPESGRVWNVPSGSERYWLKGYEIWGSEGASPPAPDPDFVELEELGG